MRVNLSGERKDLLRTKDPVEAERHYFYLCKFFSLHDGAIIINSDNDDVPNAKFRCGDTWLYERRELNQDRYEMIWATPADGWRTPTVYMMKGLLKNIIDENGKQATAKWVCEQVGMTPRAWSLWMRTDSQRRKIRYTSWNYIKSLACL